MKQTLLLAIVAIALVACDERTVENDPDVQKARTEASEDVAEAQAKAEKKKIDAQAEVEKAKAEAATKP